MGHLMNCSSNWLEQHWPRRFLSVLVRRRSRSDLCPRRLHVSDDLSLNTLEGPHTFVSIVLAGDLHKKGEREGLFEWRQLSDCVSNFEWPLSNIVTISRDHRAAPYLFYWSRQLVSTS